MKLLTRTKSLLIMKKIILFLLFASFIAQSNDVYLQKTPEIFGNFVIEDSILWKKTVLGNSILQLHADFTYKLGDNPKNGYIKNATHLALISNGNKQIVWDTSFIDKQYLHPQLVSSLRPINDMLAIGDNALTFTVGDSYSNGYLVSLEYSKITKKWGLLGCYRFPLSSFSDSYLLGLNTLWVYTRQVNKTPNIYHVNSCGDLELYELNSILDKNESISFENINKVSQTISPNKPNYYLNSDHNEHLFLDEKE